MKEVSMAILAATLLMASLLGSSSAQDLLLTGVIDGPRPGGLPKAVELFATNDISDLSAYGLGNAKNGKVSGGQRFVFPEESLSAGSFYYVASESEGFDAYFGFEPDAVAESALSINGNDNVELYFSGAVIDRFGQLGVDGTDQAWEYRDGWAYRKDYTKASTSFDAGDWEYSGAGALKADGDSSTLVTSASPFPFGTYTN